MGASAKFRALDGAAKGAATEAERAHILAVGSVIHAKQLAKAMGLEEVQEPAGEGQVRIRYRRRLPKWLTWVRRIGVWR